MSQTFHVEKILPYTQQQVFDVAADIDSYREFVPVCAGSRVLTPVPGGLAPYQVEAEASLIVPGTSILYKGVVELEPHKAISATATSPPFFKSLRAAGSLQPAHSSDKQTLVILDIECEPDGWVLGFILAFCPITILEEKGFEILEERCLKLYGKGESV